jgi:hypothetical protein
MALKQVPWCAASAGWQVLLTATRQATCHQLQANVIIQAQGHCTTMHATTCPTGMAKTLLVLAVQHARGLEYACTYKPAAHQQSLWQHLRQHIMSWVTLPVAPTLNPRLMLRPDQHRTATTRGHNTDRQEYNASTMQECLQLRTQRRQMRRRQSQQPCSCSMHHPLLLSHCQGAACKQDMWQVHTAIVS